MEISVVIPTVGRPELLRRALDRLDAQTAPPEAFEAIVVADAAEDRLDELDDAVSGRRYATRRLQGPMPGASAARNAGWRAAAAPLVLFMDDDILPEPALVAEHLDWHRRHPAEEFGVLGHVRWADELRVTPFMRWLDNGIQSDYPNIEGTEAGWARFNTSNSSVKRSLVLRVGGFEERALPFGYEDVDLALRMSAHGFRLLYNRAAVAEHLHPTDLDAWRRRVAEVAVAERHFVALHPEYEPYYHELLTGPAPSPPLPGLGARLAWLVPPSAPVLGRWVWRSADAVYRRALAQPFLEAWEAAGDAG